MMKLKNLFPLLLLALGTFGFVGCGDDEPEPQDIGQVSEANKAVVGEYAGWTHLKTAFIDRNYANDTITLSINDGGSIIATFKDATWGTATITGIQAIDENGDSQFELQGGEGSFVMNNPRQGGTQEFACKLESGLINPKDKEATVVISAYMEVGHGDMTFTFHTGEMPADE